MGQVGGEELALEQLLTRKSHSRAVLSSPDVVGHKQMFWNIKTQQKWKLSTWETIARQSNKTLVNLISIHGTRERDGLTAGN